MKALDPLKLALSGTHLIEASAGTGKTFTIGSLVLRLVAEQGVSLERILIVTFTDAASSDLKRRIRRRLRDAVAMLEGRLEMDPLVEAIRTRTQKAGTDAHVRFVKALLDFDRAPISTIHSFCQAALREHAFESGALFDTVTEADQSPLLREVVEDFWALRGHAAHPLFLGYLHAKGIEPGKLISLVRSVIAWPDRLVLPEAAAAVEAGPLFEQAFADARQAFLSGRDQIKILLQGKGIDGRRIRMETRQKALAAAERYFAAETPTDPVPPAALEKLTAGRLAAASRNPAQPVEHAFFDACQVLFDAQAAFANQALAFKLELIEYAREQVPRRKTERNVQSFDDLLLGLDDALSDQAGSGLAGLIGEAFDAVLIDEFQDTDRVQYRIFEQIFLERETPVFLIGDPKQSIYSFRGADIFAYLEAVRAAGQRTYTLGTNWRSSPDLIEAINLLFERAERSGAMPFVEDAIRYRKVQPQPAARNQLGGDGARPASLQFRFLSRQGRAGPHGVITKSWIGRHWPDLVASDILRLFDGRRSLGGRSVEPGDVAVLVRTNLLARQIQQALHRLRVPAVLASQGTVFASEQAEDLAIVLSAVAEPGDPGLVRAALSTALFGLPAHRIASLRDGLVLGAQNEDWEIWCQRFREWNGLWINSGFIRMLRALFFSRPESSAPALIVRQLSLESGERKVTNFLHLAELLHAASSAEHLGPGALLRWLGDKRIALDTGLESDQVRLESDARAVKLVTIHKSKGLEFPIVYCPDLWQAGGAASLPVAFHRRASESTPARACLDLGSDDLDANKAIAVGEIQAEAMRLTYVALTRAEQLCIVPWGGMSGYDRSALGRVLHPPALTGDWQVLARAIKGLDDKRLLTDLQFLAAKSGGVISVETMPEAEQGFYSPVVGEHHAPVCARWKRPLLRKHWGLASFSSLVARGSLLQPDEIIGLDHDLVARPSGLVSGTVDDERVPLWALDKGPKTGDCLHGVLERLDFEAADPETISQLVNEWFPLHGLSVEKHGPVVCEALGQVLDSPLSSDDSDLVLRGLPWSRRLCELEFMLPTHGDLSGQLLAEVLAKNPGPNLPDDYPSRLARLEVGSVEGFLRGFIDLVFEHRGRFYVIDYKTNYLGDSFGHYGPEALGQAMGEHHYVLQYHLYLVALDAYLRYRLSGYDPERHLGGACYLFLRGMSPEASPGRGVFFDRPSVELLGALRAVLGMGGPR